MIFCMDCLRLGARISPCQGAVLNNRQQVATWCSDRGHQDMRCGGCIEADGTAVDFDHALLAAPFAKQFKHGTREHP